jgi:hypothetical protein
MTQTPASGPFGPLTTPPMSSLSIATGPCARNCAGAASKSAATATDKAKYDRGLVLVIRSSRRFL